MVEVDYVDVDRRVAKAISSQYGEEAYIPLPDGFVIPVSLSGYGSTALDVRRAAGQGAREALDGGSPNSPSTSSGRTDLDNG